MEFVTQCDTDGGQFIYLFPNSGFPSGGEGSTLPYFIPIVLVKFLKVVALAMKMETCNKMKFFNSIVKA